VYIIFSPHTLKLTWCDPYGHEPVTPLCHVIQTMPQAIMANSRDDYSHNQNPLQT